jgi:uncharacterized Zn finger protein
MPRFDVEPTRSPLPPPVQSSCPQCSAGLVVLSIIPGRAERGGCEYWTMRCTRCGGIHLDIVNPKGVEDSIEASDNLIA